MESSLICQQIIFALCLIDLICFILLPFLLILLAICKKKLLMHIDQINKIGHIQNANELKLFYDIFLIIYIFYSLPEIKNNSNYNRFKTILKLEHRAILLTKITKPIAVVLVITTALLVILDNWGW
jgi:hypothetical protein